jgi:hypothetical protein
MTKETIVAALEAEGFKHANQAFALREEREATCFIATQGDVLPIAKLVRIEMRDKHVLLETGKNERFVFSYEDVLGFRLLGVDVKAKDRGAGFSR